MKYKALQYTLYYINVIAVLYIIMYKSAMQMKSQ